jgi:NitT/TauT family transport system substrate-binding protein
MLAVAGCGSSDSSDTSSTSSASGTGAASGVTSDTVKFAMTPPDMLWGGAVVAKQMYWPKHGLNVDLTFTQGSAQTARVIASGQQNMGVSSFSATSAAIAEGQPLKVVAVMMQRTPNSIASPQSAGISTLKDLEGKHLMHYTSGSNTILWDPVLKKAGIDMGKLHQVGIAYGADLQLLKSGQADAMESYLGSQDLKLQCDGTPVNELLLVDQGVNIYEQVVVVNTDWADKVGSKTVTKMVLGFIQGVNYQQTHPVETYEMVAKAAGVPLPREQQIIESTDVVPFLYGKDTDTIQQNGFGWGDPATTQKMLSLLHDLGTVSKELKPDDVVSNEYLKDPQTQAAAMEYAKTAVAQPPADARQKCGTLSALPK